MAAVADVEPILREDAPAVFVDHEVATGVEGERADLPGGAMFEQDGPAVRVDESETREGKVRDMREEDADIAPVARLALARDAGVGAVAAPDAVLESAHVSALDARGGGVERRGGIARRPRTICALKDYAPLTTYADAREGTHLRRPGDAVGAAEEVVAAAVGALHAAVLEDDVRAPGQQDRGVDEPVVAVRRSVGSTPPDARGAARRGGRSNRLVDAPGVVAGEVVRIVIGMFHGRMTLLPLMSKYAKDPAKRHFQNHFSV